MSIFVELVEAVVFAVVDLTATLATIASRPLRFLVSSGYRHEVRQAWRGRPAEHALELPGGSLVVVLLFSLVVLLGTAVVSSIRQRPTAAEAELRNAEGKFNRWFFRAWEKLRDAR
jgi:hypothetical protein